jgi:hypothetical protein
LKRKLVGTKCALVVQVRNINNVVVNNHANLYKIRIYEKLKKYDFVHG